MEEPSHAEVPAEQPITVENCGVEQRVARLEAQILERDLAYARLKREMRKAVEKAAADRKGWVKDAKELLDRIGSHELHYRDVNKMLAEAEMENSKLSEENALLRLRAVTLDDAT
jgi:predicted nuclease with TOPRIM domain